MVQLLNSQVREKIDYKQLNFYLIWSINCEPFN